MSIAERAKDFATRAHEGQYLYNAAREPFIMHPSRVAAPVEKTGGADEEIAVAWLHDVVEDTKITIEGISKEFGEHIAEMVDGLTDPPELAAHPNRIRKRMQAERLVGKSDNVKKIKLADQTVNITMIGEDPPVGWNQTERLEYLEGARLIANNCAGICPELDKCFDEMYKKNSCSSKSKRHEWPNLVRLI